MKSDALRQEILELSAEQRLDLLADVWDSLAEEPESVPVPDWHREELDRRLAAEKPEHLTWDQVRERARDPDPQ